MRKCVMFVVVASFVLTMITGCGTNTKKTTNESSSKESKNNVVEADSEATKEGDAESSQPSPTVASEEVTTEPVPTVIPKDPSTVYMTNDISPEGLMRIYEKLGRKATGKVAVKIHMGEPGGDNYLKPDLVKDLVLSVDGTFVDCNTAYGGRRANTAAHMQAAEDHGFTEYTSVDIMDEEGSIKLPIENGKHLTEDLVGSHLDNYDFILVLSHFKGHEMGGFGGAIKNISIGIASVEGKNMIHTAGKSNKSMWFYTEQDNFLESMAEAAKAVVDHAGENILFINVMNNISIDCDCNGSPAKPEMHDIGILASLDPVALDKACVDLVYEAPKEESDSLIQRIEAKNGTHTLDYAEEIGLGTQNYELVNIDE